MVCSRENGHFVMIRFEHIGYSLSSGTRITHTNTETYKDTHTDTDKDTDTHTRVTYPTRMRKPNGLIMPVARQHLLEFVEAICAVLLDNLGENNGKLNKRHHVE